MPARPSLLLGSATLAVLAGCTRPPADDGPWSAETPVDVLSSAEFKAGDLVESSGVVTSRTHQGVLWSINDAGNRAHLFATDPQGNARSRWRFNSGANVDWEDLALGPCPAGTCLYVGDVGDNEERRPDVTVYRFREPDPDVPDAVFVEADSLVVRYPDRPRDVEALFVDGDGTVWLVTKGRRDGVLLYRVPADAWRSRAATAELVDTLPVRAHLLSGRAVTGAATSPDQRTVVIRTYRELFFFGWSPEGRLQPSPAPNRCDVRGLEVQGEGVDWWDDSTLVLTSEAGRGSPGMVRLVRCPALRVGKAIPGNSPEPVRGQVDTPP